MLLKASIFVLFLEMVCGERVCILSGDQFHAVRTLPECAFLCGIKSGCSVFNLCKSNENNLCVTYERQGDSACLNMSLLLRCLTFIKVNYPSKIGSKSYLIQVLYHYSFVFFTSEINFIQLSIDIHTISN